MELFNCHQFFKNNFKYHTEQEIRQQPELWLQTVAIIEKQQNKIKNFFNKIIKQEKQLRIIFTGAGSSAFVGKTVVPYLNKKLPYRFEAIATTDIVTNPTEYLQQEIPTLLISSARSGNSPESIATVNIAEQVVDNLYQIALTCNPEGELARKMDRQENALMILMPEQAHDQGFAMTGSFTTMVLSALAIFNLENLDQLSKKITLIAERGTDIFTEELSIVHNIAGENYERAVYLGSSTLKGIAEEAALKMLELTRGKVATNYESSLGFRHGPKSVINDRTLIWFFFSEEPYVRQYEVDLLREIANGAKVKSIVAVTNSYQEDVKQLADYYIGLSSAETGGEDDVFLAFNYVLLAQLNAFYKSVYLGINPDNPSPSGNVNRVVKGVEIYQYRK